MSDNNYLCESCKHKTYLYHDEKPVMVLCRAMSSWFCSKYRTAKKKKCKQYEVKTND